jgi:mannose-6-phosphate isomerase-like protein (cupin superfamily)
MMIARGVTDQVKDCRRLGAAKSSLKQRPDFDEYTVVIAGTLRVEHEGGSIDVAAGQAVIAHAGEWVRYSTPDESGAEYIAVCLPAFAMEMVHRDE